MRTFYTDHLTTNEADIRRTDDARIRMRVIAIEEHMFPRDLGYSGD